MLTKQPPYPLFVMSSGNDQTEVKNRSFNGLIVGGSDDHLDSNLANDTMYNNSSFDGSSWQNPTGTHGDFELPSLVAPAVSVSNLPLYMGTPEEHLGTSFSAPIVSGIAALVMQRDATFADWPEMTRATLIATSFHPMADQTPFYRLSFSTSGTGGGNDVKQGVGLANAEFAYDLAAPAQYRAPGTTSAYRGRYRKRLDFYADFDSYGTGYDRWNIWIAQSGASRLRVAIAWDGTGSATPNQTKLDTDLDLEIYDNSGNLVCASTTYDSSWEACDIPVSWGQTYQARLQRYDAPGSTQTATYLGVAWYNYKAY